MVSSFPSRVISYVGYKGLEFYTFFMHIKTLYLAVAHRSGSISNTIKSHAHTYLDDIEVVGIGLNSNRPALSFFCFKECIDCGSKLDIYAMCLEEGLTVCNCL